MTIRAVFENGVFRPMAPVKLAEGTVVDLQILRTRWMSARWYHPAPMRG